ncbi:MAG: diacylglycerol kinase family protein [bacterium]
MDGAKVIVNPNSANGRTGRSWGLIEGEIGRRLGDFEAEFTGGPGEASGMARRALKAGFGLVVAVGGDGTIGEVVNGFFEDGRLVREDAQLGIISMGTGCDFVKTLGIPRTVPEAAAVLAEGGVVRCDAGVIQCAGADGAPVRRYFINIADFGIGGEIVERVNRTTKVMRGFLSFLLGILRVSFTYRNKPVEIWIDGERVGERTVKNVVVANGQYFGGGMRMAREARPDDGLFEVIILGDMGFVESARMIRRMYSGAVTGLNKVERFRCRRVEARSEFRVTIDADGEQVGTLPATFELIPSCIQVKAPEQPPAAPDSKG